MTHASVFSGIGGPEVAATLLGWQNLFHCEINPFGRSVLDYWYPDSKSYEDVTKTDFSEWHGKVDVLTGGFPCQPFSNAGKRRGAEDDRYLWPYMHRVIKQVRPTWFVCENVGGILSMVEQGCKIKMGSEATLFGEKRTDIYNKRSIFTIERICRDIEADGYSVQQVLIPACSVGAPHKRNRVFIIGRITKNTMRRRRSIREFDELDDEQRSRNTCATSNSGTTTNTMYSRSNKVLHNDQSKITNGNRTTRTGCERTIANSESVESYVRRDYGEHQETTIPEPGTKDFDISRKWCRFPTFPPICRGNDGLPFSLDNITISHKKFSRKEQEFNYWREESIKAYGNAIVPGVMYEIFRAIEIAENQQ